MPDTTLTEIEFTPVAVAPAPATSAVPTTVPDRPVSMLDIIDRASRDPSVDIDKLERLIGLKREIDAGEARREYDAAMSRAQEEMRPIRANLENPQTHSEYADYAALDRAIRPIYAKHGFSLSFGTGDGAPDGCVRVVCTVAAHGHRETPHLDMPADGKGARGNDVMTRTHATGAAVTYGKRYLLGMIFNLAVTRDDDGNGASGDYDGLATGPRDANGRAMSNYNARKAAAAQEWADQAIEYLNLVPNAAAAKDWRREKQAVPPGKKKSPLQWLEDASPAQFVRVANVYQNVTGEDLE